MQVKAVQVKSVGNQSNQYNFKTTSPNMSKSYVSGTNFASPNEIHGRYLSFKGNFLTLRKQQLETIGRFLAEEVAPFLERHRAFYEQNNAIRQAAHDVLEVLSKKELDFHERLRAGIKPEELDFVKQSMGKPLAHRQNVQEYKYLRDKSYKYFSAPAISDYAESIGAEAQATTPYLKSFAPSFFRLQKTERDIRNGFANLRLEQSAPELFAKRKAVYEAQSIAAKNKALYVEAKCYKEQAEEIIGYAQDNPLEHERDIFYCCKLIGSTRGNMRVHEEYCPQIIEQTPKAQALLTANTFSAEDVERAFQPIETKRIQMVDRNIKLLRKYFDEHPEYVWKSEHDAQTDALLARQTELNTALWQKIEDSKKAYFSGHLPSGRWADVPDPNIPIDADTPF